MKAVKLFDEVEVDGAYFGGPIRPENRKDDRKDRRIAFMDEGVSTNQTESFFSRLRHIAGGQHHKMSAQYLRQYAAHAAWMEITAASTTARLPIARLGWR
jgi:hypothetical protein